MANTPVDPTGSVVTADLPESAELYLAPVSETPLAAGDLVPNTTGDMGEIAPTRQVNRVPLHNGQDFVALGSLQSADFTVRVYLTDANTKLQQIKAAWTSGDPMKGNVFFRDGSGASFFARVLRVRPVDDIQANEFAYDILLSPFGVTMLDAP